MDRGWACDPYRRFASQRRRETSGGEGGSRKQGREVRRINNFNAADNLDATFAGLFGRNFILRWSIIRFVIIRELLPDNAVSAQSWRFGVNRDCAAAAGVAAVAGPSLSYRSLGGT